MSDQTQAKQFSASILYALLLSVAMYAGYELLPWIFPALAFEKKAFSFSWLMVYSAILHISVIYSVVLSLMFVRLQRYRDFVGYFAFNALSIKQLFTWVTIGAVFTVLSLWVRSLLHVPMFAWWETHLYNTTHSGIIVLAVMALLAPIVEELLFRGFILSGFLKSNLRPAISAILTSFLWTIPLTRDNPYETLLVFALGALLAVARIRTKSVVAPILTHLIYNIISGGLMLSMIADKIQIF